MKTLQGLLLDRLHAHGAHIGSTGSFEQSRRAGGIGLVPAHMGSYMLSGQQANFDAQAIRPPSPVVGRSAGFHDDQGDRPVGKPALELSAGEALGFNNAPMLIGHCNLENGFGQIDGHGSSIHVGLLSFDEDLIPTPMKTSARMSRKQTGESIPSAKHGRPTASSGLSR